MLLMDLQSVSLSCAICCLYTDSVQPKEAMSLSYMHFV